LRNRGGRTFRGLPENTEPVREVALFRRRVVVRKVERLVSNRRSVPDHSIPTQQCRPPGERSLSSRDPTFWAELTIKACQSVGILNRRAMAKQKNSGSAHLNFKEPEYYFALRTRLGHRPGALPPASARRRD
jgi:hypothetical protein